MGQRRNGSSIQKRSTAVERATGLMVEAMESRVLLSALPPTQAVAEQTVNFATGPSVVDQARSLVYVIDSTHNKVLAIDTGTGRLAGSAKLAAPATGIAVALTDDKLYVSEGSQTQIEIFNLPNFTLSDTVKTGVAVSQIVGGAGNQLYGVTNGGKSVIQLDGTTGVSSLTVDTGFTSAKLATNFAATHLYVLDTGATGTGLIPEYDISSGTTAPLITSYTALLTGAKSFAIDEPVNHIYVANTGVDGIEVVNTSTNTESVWSFGGPTSAVAVTASQGVPFVYGASSGPGGATIRQWDLSGNPIADYPIDNYSGLSSALTTDPDSLRVTPTNGHVYFSANTSSGAGGQIGIIGVSSVDVAAPVASFTVNNTGGRAYSFNGTSSSAPKNQKITSWTWDFGDGTNGVGATTFHTYAANGTYTVTLTVTASGGNSDTTSQTVTVFALTATPTPTPTGSAVLGGLIFNDVNNNGRYGKGDGTVRGFNAYLDLNHNSRRDITEPLATSGFRGTFLFQNLPTGSYQVGLIAPPGWAQTLPRRGRDFDVTVASGASNTTLFFGVHLVDPVAARNAQRAGIVAVKPAAAKVKSSSSNASLLSSTYTLLTKRDVL